MQTSPLVCPFCGSTLKFSTTIAAGSPVECLICMQTFVTQARYVPSASTAPPPPSASKAPGKTEPGKIKVAPKAGVPANSPQSAIATGAKADKNTARAKPSVPSADKPAPRRLADTAEPGGRGPMIAVVLGVLLLAAAGGGIAVWKIGNTPGTDDTAKPDSPIALKNPTPDNPTPPGDGGGETPKKIDPPLTKKTTPPTVDPDDEEERLREIEAAKKLLVRKTPVKAVGKEPTFDPVDSVNPGPQFPFGLDQARIDKSVSRGIAYLRTTQNPNGTWGGVHGVGYASLGGLTMLECDVPANDACVQRAATFVRNTVGGINFNYEMALAVLFLDRLGDPRDRILIQGVALRILAGQLDGGGWNYQNPMLDAQEMHQLYAFLQSHRQPNAFPAKAPQGKGANPPMVPRVGLNHRDLHPEFKQFSDLILKLGLDDPNAADDVPMNDKKKDDAAPPMKQPKKKLAPIRPETLRQTLQSLPIVKNYATKKGQFDTKATEGDNSNTQFALLALWTARRYNVPTEQAILASYQRFSDSQLEDGSWGYYVRRDPSPSMTCVGLLAEALGHGVSPDRIAADPDNPKATTIKPALQDPHVQKALKALARRIGTPSKTAQAFPMEDMYLLWSIERVAVLYDLKLIDGKDWYGWGAQVLVHNQDAEGAWTAYSNYHSSTTPLNTCFALLFLRRSNLVADLTNHLRLQAGIRD